MLKIFQASVTNAHNFFLALIINIASLFHSPLSLSLSLSLSISLSLTHTHTHAHTHTLSHSFTLFPFLSTDISANNGDAVAAIMFRRA